MAGEPQRKYQQDTEPDIRPDLRLIQGGGEVTPRRANLRAVNSSEENPVAPPDEGSVLDKEENPDKPNNIIEGPWEDKTTVGGPRPTNGSKLKGFFSGLAKRKLPLGAIGLTLGLGGLSIGGLLSTALINIRETVTNQVDSVTSVIGERQGVIMRGKLFDTSTTCVIKVKCRYVGITQNMLDRLNYEGAQLVDKDGNPAKKNILGKYSGATLILKTGEKIDATNFNKEFRASKELRRITGIVMKPRWLAWNDPTAKGLRAAKKLTQNPQGIGDQDEKKNRKAWYSQVSGTTQAIATAADVLNGLDEDGNPIETNDGPVSEDNPGAKVDPGTALEDINADAKDLQTKALAGEKVPVLTDDIETIANSEPYAGRFSAGKLFQGLASAINPVGVVADLCTAYQLVSATVAIARVTELAYSMRYAATFFALADKQKTGDISGEELEEAMGILTRPDAAGDTFGDSFSWQQMTGGTIPEKPLTVGATGNSVIQLLSDGLRTVRDSFGGTSGVTALCIGANLLTLTAFIPGAGQLATLGGKIVGGAAKFATKEGAKLAIKEAVESAVKTVASKVGSRAAIKQSSIAAFKSLKKIAKDPAMAVFVVSFLAERYAVPYAAQQLAGTALGADSNGVQALDAIKTGGDAQNAELAVRSGFLPTNDPQKVIEQTRFNASYLSGYIAQERQNANPFDLNNPYSFVGTLSTSMLPFLTKAASIQTNASAALSLPATLMGTLKTSLFGSNVSAATDEELLSVYEACQDDSVLEDVVKLPNCVPALIPPEGYNSDVPGTQVVDELIAQGSLSESGQPVGDLATRVSVCMSDESSLYDEAVINSCYNTEQLSTAAAQTQGLYVLDQRIIDGLDGESDRSTTDEIVSPVAEGFRLTDKFGPREAPCAGCSTWHVGLDMVNNTNRDVRAIRAGTVIQANKSGGNNIVKIQHEDGLISEYFHMFANDIVVSTGQTVAAGDVIGKIGNSGDSTGAHLHFVLDISQVAEGFKENYASYTRNTGGPAPVGSRIDPLEYFRQAGIAGY